MCFAEYAILCEGDSPSSIKSSHFTELSQTPPELAKLQKEALLVKVIFHQKEALLNLL